MTKERVFLRPEGVDAAAETALLERGRRRGFLRFVVRPGLPFSALPGEEVYRLEDTRLVPSDPGRAPIPIASVSDASELQAVAHGAEDGATIAVEWTGDWLIPLENLVAARGRRFHLWTLARRITEVPGALGALEHGADRVVVTVHSVDEIDQLEHALERELPFALDWQVVPLRSVKPAGLGDRVIVDTTSILAADEGLLVGSAAAFLFHVASEAVGTRFSRPRSFRVNAGAAHSYVLMADGSTRYLAELGPGDTLLATTPNGRSRPVRVGRLKVERRPMIVLEAEAAGASRTLFLQEAESVRVSTDQGRVATTEIAPGQRVQGVRLPPARHLGHAIEETIEER